MFIALRDLRFARGRFGLMATVIGLISLLVVLLSRLTTGLSDQSVSAIASLPADHIAFAAPAAGDKMSFSTSRVTGSQSDSLARGKGVEATTPLGIAPAQLSARGKRIAVAAFGADPGTFLSPAGLRDGSVVLSRQLAKDEKLTVGDSVAVGGDTLTIAALADQASFNHMPVAWIARSAWRKLDAAGGAEGTVIAMRINGSADLAALDLANHTLTTDRSGALTGIGSYTAENGSLTLMRILLLAVSALVVGAFFTVWTIQRTPDLAVLKAIGASTGYLVKDALVQALAVLILGGGAGTLLAAGLGWAAARAVPFVVSPATTLIPLLALLAVGMVGAASSLHRIATVDPLTALGAAR